MKTINRNTLFIIIFSIIVFFITVVFLWQEPTFFDIHKTINNQKIADYFTSIGSIGSVGALIFLYLQLREMKRQSMASLKPELYILSTVFESNELYSEANNLELYNLGRGYAKCVEVEWIYDVNGVIQEGGNFSSPATGIEKFKYDFVPIEGHIKIRLPQFYLTCCGGDIISLDEEEFSKVKPKLTLRIYYQAINDEKFTASFEAKILEYVPFDSDSQIKSLSKKIKFEFSKIAEYGV
ncbi:hypothetical protein V7S77_03155 [Aquirufa ecclesiirivi]